EEGLIYRCFKTRAELSELMAAPHGTTKAEPATSPLPPLEEKRRLADGQPFAWRLHAARARQHLGQDTLDWREMDSGGIVHGHQSDLLDLTDVVLARKETPTSYHLASVIDDGEQGVDLVWRGEDLRSAVPIHRVLQELLGITAPVYRHHRLITNDKGQRLAKRDQAETLQVMRMSGVTPSQIRQRLGLDVRTS
ncbi:MAG: glutamate--tRNA ligase family protein, partial [Pseudomonadota bacterium]